jgi:hypothetical protein
VTIKEWRSKLEELIAEFGGGKLSIKPGGHIALRLNNGGLVHVAATPSDWRTLKNVRRDLRKATREAQAKRGYGGYTT